VFASMSGVTALIAVPVCWLYIVPRDLEHLRWSDVLVHQRIRLQFGNRYRYQQSAPVAACRGALHCRAARRPNSI
jgi:hypothetical protein